MIYSNKIIVKNFS